MALAPHGSFAIYPLTLFDHLLERSTFVTGWLVEGDIDIEALASALARVTDKWRMLAGRLDCKKDQRDQWFLRIPLGPLHPSYSTFTLTETVSQEPLSQYVSVPLAFSTRSFPSSIFIHPSTPRGYKAWKSNQHPLTCWHLTRFPASSNGPTYTCIGFARCHGIFDGTGATLVVNAVISELSGRDWDVPPLPTEGLNINPLQSALDEATQEHRRMLRDFPDCREFTPMGTFGALRMIFRHACEVWWRKARAQIFIIPEPAISGLVRGVRDYLQEKYQGTIRVSTGDVLVAWLMKTIYSSGTPCSRTVHCSNIASIRSLLSDDKSILEYPHNAWVPLPYPLFSVAQLNELPLPEIVHRMTTSRLSLSASHVLGDYHILQNNSFAVPFQADVEEIFMVSNVSSSRILEADWTCAGASHTVCGYRYSCSPTGLIVTNSAYLSGRLPDSSFVIDTTLNEVRMNLLRAEVERLITEFF